MDNAGAVAGQPGESRAWAVDIWRCCRQEGSLSISDRVVRDPVIVWNNNRSSLKKNNPRSLTIANSAGGTARPDFSADPVLENPPLIS